MQGGFLEKAITKEVPVRAFEDCGLAGFRFRRLEVGSGSMLDIRIIAASRNIVATEIVATKIICVLIII